MDRLLRSIFEGTATAVGDDFFRALVRQLARTLHVPFAWVSECVDPPEAAPSRVQTLAFWVGRDFGANAEYALSGTPCEDVLRSGECRVYEQDLRAAFPGDACLGEIGVESYLGVPLLAASGRVLGHLAVMDRKPLEDAALKETVLRTFAARTAAEMERRRAERERERLLRELQRALANLRTLRGLIHACAWCRKIRDDEGHWDELQAFVESHSEVKFTHGICPECRERITAEAEERRTG